MDTNLNGEIRVEALEKKIKTLEKKVKTLEKSNRNWRRKVQRLRNGHSDELEKNKGE